MYFCSGSISGPLVFDFGMLTLTLCMLFGDCLEILLVPGLCFFFSSTLQNTPAVYWMQQDDIKGNAQGLS